MRNFKVMLDLSDCFQYVRIYKLIEFDAPFLTVFIQANDPDEVCYELTLRLINQILKKDKSMEARVNCRKIKKLIRFDKIQSL